MKRLGMLVTASMLIAGASAASAATINGTIKSIDTKTHELILEDGKTYTVADNVKLVGLNPGDKIKINAEMKNGKSVVDKVEQTSTAAMNGTPSAAGSAATGSSGGVSGSLKDTAVPSAKTPTD